MTLYPLRRSSFRDITGQRFGRLVALRPMRNPAHHDERHVFWLCLCDCGKRCITLGSSLRRKHRPTRSCGCLQWERIDHPVEVKMTQPKWQATIRYVDGTEAKPPFEFDNFSDLEIFVNRPGANHNNVDHISIKLTDPLWRSTPPPGGALQ